LDAGIVHWHTTSLRRDVFIAKRGALARQASLRNCGRVSRTVVVDRIINDATDSGGKYRRRSHQLRVGASAWKYVRIYSYDVSGEVTPGVRIPQRDHALGSLKIVNKNLKLAGTG
jgi:hypothetical protein